MKHALLRWSFESNSNRRYSRAMFACDNGRQVAFDAASFSFRIIYIGTGFRFITRPCPWRSEATRSRRTERWHRSRTEANGSETLLARPLVARCDHAWIVASVASCRIGNIICDLENLLTRHQSCSELRYDWLLNIFVWRVCDCGVWLALGEFEVTCPL